jgi:hypothetical protein
MRRVPVPARTILAAAVAAAFAAAGCGGSGGGAKPQASEGPQGPPAPAPLRSRPDLQPPPVAVERADGADGLTFVSPRLENVKRDGDAHQQGALALDGHGRTVWWRPAPDGEPVTDVRVQRFRGEPVLTWWQGAASKYGIGRGEGVIVDQRYRTVATVQAGNGHTIDLHEFLLTPRGTALVTIYARQRRDLTELGGGPDAQVTEGIVQEIDVDSGEVLLEWHSLDHVEPSESHRELPEDRDQSWDYFHINSVAEDDDGNLLVSARHTSAIYKVDRRTGDVIWRLGGKKSDFRMGEGAEFGIQHDARWLGDGRVQLFDNAAEREGEGRRGQPPSSVKVLRLDERRRRVTLEREIVHPHRMWALSQGNAQTLAGGGTMVGWGSTGTFSRHDAGGRPVFTAQLPAHYDTYRAYHARWRGRPEAPPAIHAEREEAQVAVWASWNGATEVDRWRLLAGPSPDELRPVPGDAPWTDLETAIVRFSAERYVAVAALDADGRELARSKAVDVGRHTPAG